MDNEILKKLLIKRNEMILFIYFYVLEIKFIRNEVL